MGSRVTRLTDNGAAPTGHYRRRGSVALNRELVALGIRPPARPSAICKARHPGDRRVKADTASEDALLGCTHDLGAGHSRGAARPE